MHYSLPNELNKLCSRKTLRFNSCIDYSSLLFAKEFNFDMLSAYEKNVDKSQLVICLALKVIKINLF